MENSKNISEKEILLEYKNSHDQKKLFILFEDYIELVYGVGLKYFKNPTDAEDLVMNIYELITKKLKTHNVDNFKSWLYVVTKNYCFEKLRKKTRNLSKEKEAAIMYSEAVFHLDNINNEDLIKKLKKCINVLNEEQKLCVEEFYYKSMSYDKIAAKNNISWNRVRSHIQNGRRMLKNCLEQNA